MMEIGGYLELDSFYDRQMLYEEGIKLNCGRNCLAYLIKANNIKKILMPYLNCDAIFKTCSKYGVSIRFYHISEDFKPLISEVAEDEWLYVVNYYGQLSREYLLELTKRYQKIIFDFAQSYFEMPIPNIGTLYTCRKFFGVPDGAILFTNKLLDENLPRDESFERIHFVLGRYERSAGEFYQEASENNNIFHNEPIKTMSRLTENILHAVDYESIKRKRTQNYNYLFSELNAINRLKLKKIEGAYAYPLLIENGASIRKKLIKQKLFIPTLWPNVLDSMDKNTLEFEYSNNILPIPVDQRYGLKEMQFICNLFHNEV